MSSILSNNIDYSVVLVSNVSLTDTSDSEGSRKVFAVITGVIDDDKYISSLTKEYVDKLVDPIFQTMLISQPTILEKIFNRKYPIVSKVISDKLFCSITTDFFSVEFVLVKEIVDELSLMKKNMTKMMKRIEKLEDDLMKAKSVKKVYIEYPGWTEEVKSDVMDTIEEKDPAFASFTDKQHNTTKVQNREKYCQTLTSLEQVSAWLSYLYWVEKLEICRIVGIKYEFNCNNPIIRDFLPEFVKHSNTDYRQYKVIYGKLATNNDIIVSSMLTSSDRVSIIYTSL